MPNLYMKTCNSTTLGSHASRSSSLFWLRAVVNLKCFTRILNLGYLSSNILYLQRSKYQIQKKEVRQPLSHPCFHVVFQEIFLTEATHGLSQKSKTAWINNQAHTKACTFTPWIYRIIYHAAVVTLWC